MMEWTRNPRPSFLLQTQKTKENKVQQPVAERVNERLQEVSARMRPVEYQTSNSRKG